MKWTHYLVKLQSEIYMFSVNKPCLRWGKWIGSVHFCLTIPTKQQGRPKYMSMCRDVFTEANSQYGYRKRPQSTFLHFGVIYYLNWLPYEEISYLFSITHRRGPHDIPTQGPVLHLWWAKAMIYAFETSAGLLGRRNIIWVNGSCFFFRWVWFTLIEFLAEIGFKHMEITLKCYDIICTFSEFSENLRYTLFFETITSLSFQDLKNVKPER